jgi:epimerase transport system membrane fusion protein
MTSQTISPDPVSDLPTDDRAIRMVGLLILLFGFGGFLLWAALAPIEGAAVAHGVLVVKSARKTIQHFEGGIVDEILVREGDQVQAGDILIHLDDTEASSQLESVRSQYVALAARSARLLAERDNLSEISFPSQLLQMQQQLRINEAIDGERRVFEARRQALNGEKTVLRQRAEQLAEQILGLQAQEQSKRKRIRLYQEEIDGLKELFAKGLGDKSRLREWERLVAELEGECAEHQAAIAAARVQISETELQIVQREREFRTEVVSELRDIETRLTDLSERMRALEKTLQRTEIRAPVSGSIVGMALHTIGGVIRPGEDILDIVPNNESLIVEAQVSPIDIDRVFPGLEADLRMSAFNARTTPEIPGRVLTVSADSLTNQHDGQSYYLARIQVTDDGLDSLEGRVLQPGMPVEVMIKTGERTFLEYLLRPITDIFARAFKEE